MADLTDGLIDIQELAADKDGKMLVWVGESLSTEPVVQPQTQSPASYTPPHLAVRILDEAIDVTVRRGEVWNKGELYRRKGEIILQSGGDPSSAAVEREVEACFEKALEIAKDHSAKSWQLRAATSLARLWQQQGKQTEARELLAEIYNWFTEGFDTKDLQEAGVLLEELG